MNNIENTKRSNVFGAIKLIEQLYLDNLIPGYVFHNIINEYSGDISVAKFKCYKDKSPPKKRNKKCMD